MSTYKALVGKKIKSVSSDPSDSIDGQMWYNTTTGTLRGLALLKAWSSGGSLITGRYLSGSLGTQTAGVQIAGSNPPKLTNVEHYDGTGWREGAAYPAAGSSMSGAGTQTAGIAYGGNTPSMTANAFDYNGTAWTAANSLPYVANNIASCGLEKTNVIGAVGRDGSSGNSGTNKSVTFDGTNFANGPNINTTRMFNNSSGAGTGTAALIVGGFIDPSPNAMTNCEEYNGSSWTATGTLNVATGFASAFGIQTNAVAQTNGSNYVETEGYDGSTWTVLPSMSVYSPGGLYGSSAGSTGDAGWVSSMSPNYNATEEFNASTNIITAAAWSSAATLPEARYTNAGAGTTTAALNWGGVPPTSSTTVEFDGSSWGSGGAYPYAIASHGGTGLQTAALSVGGLDPGSAPAKNDSYEYNGTSWTGNATYPQEGFGTRVWGIQTSAVATGGGGYPSPPRNTTTANSYNGTSWTGETAFSTVRSFHTNGGSNESAGIIMGGRSTPGAETAINNTEEYNGTSWTAGGDYITVNKECTGWGIQTDLMQAGGSVPSATATCAIYNGTSWTTTASLPTALTLNATTQGTFNTNSGFTMGGYSGSTTNAVSEFTPGSTAVNIKTFSTS